MRGKYNKLVTYDYEGASISFQRGENVMINATEMAKCFGKKPAEWLRLPSTIEYINAMTEVGFSHNDVIQTVRGGIDGGTTWMHKTLAVEFSRWLSPSFSIWCNQKIEELLRTGEVSIRKKSPSKNRVDATMAWIKGVSEVFSLDDVSQQRMYNKFAEDYDLPLVEYTPANGGRDSISRLLKMNGIGMSAMVANKKLAEQGYLIQRDVHRKGGKVSHYYEVTEKGKQFGDNFQSEHNPKETQPLWYVDKFTDLLPLFQP